MTITIKDYGKWELSLNSSMICTLNFTIHLAMDKVVMLYKGRVIFKLYSPRVHKCFGIKIYKLCDMTGYTYDMRIYLGKGRQNATQMTATCVTQ